MPFNLFCVCSEFNDCTLPENKRVSTTSCGMPSLSVLYIPKEHRPQTIIGFVESFFVKYFSFLLEYCRKIISLQSSVLYAHIFW